MGNRAREQTGLNDCGEVKCLEVKALVRSGDRAEVDEREGSQVIKLLAWLSALILLRLTSTSPTLAF